MEFKIKIVQRNIKMIAKTCIEVMKDNDWLRNKLKSSDRKKWKNTEAWGVVLLFINYFLFPLLLKMI